MNETKSPMERLLEKAKNAAMQRKHELINANKAVEIAQARLQQAEDAVYDIEDQLSIERKKASA